MELEAAATACAERFASEAPTEALRLEGAKMHGLGASQLSKLASQLAERIDVPQQLRVAASQLHVKAQALNPGQRDEPSTGRGRKGTGVEGWWTIPPVSDNKASRTVA